MTEEENAVPKEQKNIKKELIPLDGSIVISLDLEDAAFQAKLTALRQTAAQTAAQALGPLNTALEKTALSFSAAALSAQGWSGQLMSLFQSAAAGAKALLPQLTAAGASAGAKFLSGLRTADSYGAGRKLSAALLSGFSAGSYLEAGQSAAARIAQGLFSGAGTVQSAASGLAACVRSGFSGGWYSLGYQISSGIAAGVQGGGGLITSAAVSAAYSALSAAKRALGVRSPSRVFRDQVGYPISAGIAQGVEAGTPAVQGALRRQSMALLDTARRDIRPSLSTVSSPVSGGTKAAPLSASAPVELRVETPLYLDGRELARATAKYTGAQLRWEGSL